MTIQVDPSKVKFYSGFNAYKNTGVKSASVVVSGTLGAGATADYDKTIALTEQPVFFTILVKTTGFIGGAARWQTMPSALYYDVPASGPAASLAVLLAVVVNGTNVTLRAWAHNPYDSTLTFTTTTIEFKFVPYTLVA